MKDHKEQTDKLTTKQRITTSLVAGAIAGAFAKTVIAPLDRAKINFQVSHSRFSYKALYKFLSDNVHNNGVLSLWRGNLANMIRVVPSASINFTAHEQWKRILGVDVNQSTPFRRILAGSLAGMTACLVTYPADLTRARMAVTSRLEYGSLIQMFKITYRNDGIIGLYRGFLPTLLGSIPYAGCGYFTYETLKRLHKSIYNDEPHPINRMIYGALAGAAGQTSSYPLDVVRRRMQTAKLVNQEEASLKPVEIFKKILREEGFIRGLYKGLSMNWIKGPIAAGIGFMAYDILQYSIRKHYLKLIYDK